MVLVCMRRLVMSPVRPMTMPMSGRQARVRRTGSGKFTIDQCLPLGQIETLSLPEIEKRLIPVHEAAPRVAL